jgi:23S rRNA (guanosine2251-2'-O)-methyltransferase
MVIYGRNPVREAIRGPREVRQVWVTHKAAQVPWVDEAPSRARIVGAEEIERRAGSADHQGICAEVSPFVYADPTVVLETPSKVIVALDQIQDPQNLGAICRTAECAGAGAVVIPERRSAEITPAVCKASAGAVEHLPVLRVRNLADFLAEAKRAGRWCYGADAEAAASYDSVDYAESAVLVLGAEGHGLRPRVAAACDLLVSVPLRGRIDSLNVSAAAAVLIYGLMSP